MTIVQCTACVCIYAIGNLCVHAAMFTTFCKTVQARSVLLTVLCVYVCVLVEHLTIKNKEKKITEKKKEN